MSVIERKAKTALLLKKSWARRGKKGWHKQIANRAERSYGKALVKNEE